MYAQAWLPNQGRRLFTVETPCGFCRIQTQSGGISRPVEPSLTLHPIGHIRSPKQVKFQARHQPTEGEPERSVLELLPGHNYETALRDLSRFSKVWLIWWFHRNSHWKPLVLPPRGPAIRRGVFATRSPHRPNPLGLSTVTLIRVERRRLLLGACDLVDGTPVFDIKPYIPSYDAFPDASGGWCEDLDQELVAPPSYCVEWTPLAQTQADWLFQAWQIDFRSRLVELLERDPTPHRTRRIRRRGDGEQLEIGCGAWRARFHVRAAQVTILWLEPGYPRRFLTDPARDILPDREAQLAFLERWPPVPEETKIPSMGTNPPSMG